MLQVEECQQRADEFARLAEETVNPLLIARYRFLEASWLYLVRRKHKARAQREARLPVH